MLPRCPVLLTMLLAQSAWASAYTWPGAAPCNGTLQACITAVPSGARIEIATAVAIDENIAITDKSLTLTAADGAQPAFAPNRHVSVSANATGGAGSPSVSVSKLRFTDGYLVATYAGTATATYDFEDLTLTRASSDLDNYIQIEGNGGTTNVTLINNRLSGVPSSINRGLIYLYSGGATLNANACYNQVTSTSATGIGGGGILADLHSGAAGTLKLHGNTVRGDFYRGAIFASEGLFSSTTSNVTARVYNNAVICAASSSGEGIGFVVNNGQIDAQAINNTVSGCYDGISATQWDTGSAGANISGTVRNNLIVAHNGLEFTTAITGSLGNDYNLINATSNAATLGANTITAPANLVLDTAPRLRADSPAIDAADNATLGFGLILNGLPTDDADGLRRFKGNSSLADIGAYEFGDVNATHVARTSTIPVSHVTVMDNASVNGNTGARLLATPNFSISAVAYNHPFGTYYYGPTAQWALFGEDFGAMPAGMGFDVLAPAPGGGSFVHVTSAASITGNESVFSDSSTDSLADRVVLVTQNWTAGGSGIYNAHPIGVYFGGDSKWHVANLDGAAMPQNVGFNLYAQEPSPNAFRVAASAGNDPSGALRLDHPLLDNTPCARPQVTRLYSATTSDNFDVFYQSGKWFISGSAAAINPGELFHVLVDPRQVFDCTDRIYADGFSEDVNDF